METGAAFEASGGKDPVPKEKRRKSVMQEERTKAEVEDEKKKAEAEVEDEEKKAEAEAEADLDRQWEEYLRLSAMAPNVEVVVEEEGALPPSTEEGPLDCFGWDLCAIIGRKGEEKKAAARRVLDECLAEKNARERLKAEPMEPAADDDRRKVEEPNGDSETTTPTIF